MSMTLTMVSVCFHLQQTAEKYLKGFLICKSGMLEWGHSLLKMCKKAETYDATFSLVEKIMRALS